MTLRPIQLWLTTPPHAICAFVLERALEVIYHPKNTPANGFGGSHTFRPTDETIKQGHQNREDKFTTHTTSLSGIQIPRNYETNNEIMMCKCSQEKSLCLIYYSY